MKIIPYEGEERVQVNDFHAENLEECHNFWRDLLDQYADNEIDFCYHNCEIPIDFMSEIGAVVLESCLETRLTRENFTPLHGLTPTLVTDENFAAFAELHDKTDPGMYWTSERIRRDVSLWRIYMSGEAYVMMSLWSTVAEVFALENANAEEGAVLLSAAVAFGFETNKESILFMVDDDAALQAEAARLVGFMECGRYIAYRGVVKPLPLHP